MVHFPLSFSLSLITLSPLDSLSLLLKIVFSLSISPSLLLHFLYLIFSKLEYSFSFSLSLKFFSLFSPLSFTKKPLHHLFSLLPLSPLFTSFSSHFNALLDRLRSMRNCEHHLNDIMRYRQS